MKRLTIGILAHVDAGKTTLSEMLLYKTGEIRRLGRVDRGDTFLDNNSLERSRGITIFSKQAVLKHNDCIISLLDTPGHIDFSVEAERVLQVLDYAVLVISGSDGVQSHTETLWRLLSRYNIPTFLFINKMDIAAKGNAELIGELSRSFGSGFADFSMDRTSEVFYEAVSMCDNMLMEQFLENGSIKDEDITAAVAGRRIFPCCFGSALKDIGIDDFIGVLCGYTSQPVFGSEFGAKVFKIADDGQGNRLSYMKITGGSLKVKDVVSDNNKKWSEKVNQIRIYSGVKYHTVDEAESGTVCAVTGLSKAVIGQGLGAEHDSFSPVIEPVLSYRIDLPSDVDAHTALSRLKILEEEDPQLHIVWNEQLQEIHIALMGKIQLEILKSIIAERFGMNVDFSSGGITYKETIENKVEGVGHYEPLRHYAEVHLILEPGERGSGVQLRSSCREDDLDKNWQRLILSNLQEKTHIGVLTGSPITDIKITLASGRAHLKHTEGGDFRQACWRAVRNGLMKAKSVVLEPRYDFHLEVPNENVGRALTDLQQMCGEFEPPVSDGETSVIIGNAPVSEMQDYHSSVISYTHGKGRLICSVKGYFPCHDQERVIAAAGYDPESDLDNSADSVFCAHGAGFNVKWDEVCSYMHLESALKEQNDDFFEPITRQQVSSYRDRLIEDKELMEIFERTYGPIKRDKRTAMHTEKEPPSSKKFKASPLPKGPEYLLVDGYNIIFAWDELNKAAEESLDLARSLLINMLCNYQGFRQCNVILVFDAYKVKGSVGEVEKVNNITVVYTKEAETADTYIEKATHDLSKENRVRVATSDNLEQTIILGNGAYRISAAEFYDEIKRTEKAIKEFIETL
ncbi:MAG: NYN domain-containing protein [Oscillospiraceae bacterium]